MVRILLNIVMAGDLDGKSGVSMAMMTRTVSLPLSVSLTDVFGHQDLSPMLYREIVEFAYYEVYSTSRLSVMPMARSKKW